MNALALHLVVAIVPAAGPEMVLVAEGEPRCCVVIPDDASETVRRAAEELAAYVERISGASLPVVAEREAGSQTQGSRKRIDVGPTQKSLAQVPEGFLGDEERVLIRSVPSGVLVSGGGDRGTLFAVYRFLELLGYRWLAPGAENEVVPKRSTLAVGNVDVDTRPAFAWRLFSGRSGEESEAWGVKMGMNGLYTPEAAERNGNAYYYPEAVPGVHAYAKIMPERYFKTHPEWYPMLGGKRVPGELHGKQLCVTAEGLADEFAANVIRIFDEDPACGLTSISPNDGYGWCDCPDCEGLDDKLCGGRTTAQGLNRARPFRGDRVFWFANEVARRVAEKHPDKKLLVLAYVNYAEPPDTVRPLSGVVPFLCHYAPADYSRPINDPASEPNRQFNDSLTRWAKVTPELLMYSYVSKSQWWRLPRPVVWNFAADVKYFHSLGIRRYFCQSSLSDWPLDGPLYYVIARLLWDPLADPRRIADEWTEAMFGPAAPDVKAFYEAVDAAARKTGQSYAGNPRTQIPGLFDPPLMDEALAAIERAEKVDADETVNERVAEVARTFRYGYWMVRAMDEYERYRNDFDPDAYESAVQYGRKALEYCNVPNAAEYVESWETSGRMTREMGVPAMGFGEAETKGGRRCWNSDETGPGDHANGWATFVIRTPDASRPVVVEIDVWGTSALSSIVVNTGPGVWTPVKPNARLSRKEQWDTLEYEIPPPAMAPDRPSQKIGFGGADSQVWIAEIRVREP
ncbi:MAG TPA: DUF4838 domain-containing protein [Thermoguttaceae bacterium]|nr:DUF4838 domain-containing protein [Thermoguttaceae bacterium]